MEKVSQPPVILFLRTQSLGRKSPVRPRKRDRTNKRTPFSAVLLLLCHTYCHCPLSWLNGRAAVIQTWLDGSWSRVRIMTTSYVPDSGGCRCYATLLTDYVDGVVLHGLQPLVW